ncbi:MAG TPA: hypothetical protein VNM70_14465, partial [Burkholderiales bacterium]|nr:hypothetical protein [Burkholderiales bacterium]
MDTGRANAPTADGERRLQNKISQHSTETIFEVGRNCYAVANAARATLLVDGDAYFKAFAHAAERAQHSIIILAWDFD